MAIPRMFNSNTSFIIVTGGSELTFLGKEDMSESLEEEKDPLVQAIAPHLSRVMKHGTAKHVVTEGQEACEEEACMSIVAQAESEDFQEFSPTKTQSSYSRTQLLKSYRLTNKVPELMSDSGEEEPFSHQHLQRKQRRKSRRQTQEEGEEPPIIQGLWVQEIDWLKSTERESKLPSEIIPPPPQFTDSCSCTQPSVQGSCSCADVLEDASAETDDTSSSDHRGGPDSDGGLEEDSESICTHDSESDSSFAAEVDTQAAEDSNLNFDLMHVSGLNSYPHTERDSDATGRVQSPLGKSDSTDTLLFLNISRNAFGDDDLSDSDTVLDFLRGRVTQMPRSSVSPFFRDFIKQTMNSWRRSKAVTEGILFHHLLQPNCSQYREGEEYSVLHHIQNGSYGDVFCVRDKNTGFKCAAKRIPLSHFSSEEVSTWSALHTPRVVKLLGAVREGINMVLFMDLKPACLVQLLKEMNCLPEDLALHYHHQILGALEHLHHRQVLHLDVKVDNVLLSADCRDTFLCDFGLSETLDGTGLGTKAFRGAALPGTESHMAPEVARGDQLCTKADVWSSCCMLLHMLNGCQPWIRYYSHPLCMQIVHEPAPLWEVPSNCNNFTAEVFRAGLQKDPEKRTSAKELRRKTIKALRAVGGLSPLSVRSACEKLHQAQAANKEAVPPILATKPSAPAMYWVSPWRTTAVDEDSNNLEDDYTKKDCDPDTDSFTGEWDSQPKTLKVDYDYPVDYDRECDIFSDSDVDIYTGEGEHIQKNWLKTEKDYEGDWEEEGDEEEEEDEEDEDWNSSVSTKYLSALRGLFPLLQKGQQKEDNSWGSEPELEYLRDDVPKGTKNQTPSPEPRDDPPSCFSCSDSSQIDASDNDSDHSSDDLSSGVFSSCNSQTIGHLEWLGTTNQPSLHAFEGVDIWIENVQGECLRIRERRQVKVGHVAIGISDQISGKAFTLETLDRKTVSFDEEIKESCLWLRCVPAPDRCPRWSWRVRDGKLELQE